MYTGIFISKYARNILFFKEILKEKISDKKNSAEKQVKQTNGEGCRGETGESDIPV